VWFSQSLLTLVCVCCNREAWGERLVQLRQQELQEVAEAREKALEVRALRSQDWPNLKVQLQLRVCRSKSRHPLLRVTQLQHSIRTIGDWVYLHLCTLCIVANSPKTASGESRQVFLSPQ